jgi:hypothetical protein
VCFFFVFCRRTDRMYAYNSIMQQLADTHVKSVECLKLVLLFALRYEKEGPRQVHNNKTKIPATERCLTREK